MQFSSIIQTNKQFLLRINVELTYTKYSLRKITRTVYTLNVCQPKTPNRTHSVNLPLLAQMTGRLCNPQHGLSQHIAQRLEVQWLCIRGEPQTSRLLARTTRSTYSHAFACASAKVMNLRPTRKALVPEPHRTKKKTTAVTHVEMRRAKSICITHVYTYARSNRAKINVIYSLGAVKSPCVQCAENCDWWKLTAHMVGARGPFVVISTNSEW